MSKRQPSGSRRGHHAVRRTTVNRRNTFAHEGWDQLGSAFASANHSRRKSHIQSEDATKYTICSPTSSPNDVAAKEDCAVIEDFEDDAAANVQDEADSLIIRQQSCSPSSSFFEQDYVVISSLESPLRVDCEPIPPCLRVESQASVDVDKPMLQSLSPTSSLLFSDGGCREMLTDDEVEESLISTYSSPVAKKSVKGSEWLMSFATAQDHCKDDASAALLTEPNGVAPIGSTDHLAKKRKFIKGGLAEYFETLLKHREETQSSAERLNGIVALHLTDVLSDVGPTAFACDELPELSTVSVRSKNDNLGVILSSHVVKQMSICSGRVIRIRSPWHSMRVAALNTTFIVSPVVADVEVAATSLHRPLRTLRWRCSCSRESSCHTRLDHEPTECCDGLLLLSNVDMAAAFCSSSTL